MDEGTDVNPALSMIEQPIALRPSTPVRAAGDTVAVWDVDGTLVLGDTLLPFLRRFVGAPRLAAILAESFARARRQPDRRAAAKAAVVQRVLGGRELAAVDSIARTYVSDLVMRRVRPDCLRRWGWHRERGHRLVLASASLDLYLTHLGRLLGADEVISTRMSVVNGRVTGHLATPNCRGAEKADRVREHLAARPAGRLWAYGNSASDELTLALADNPVRVSAYRPLPAPDDDAPTGTGW